MYRILGSDGKEYGPASADQVREWMAQGRANAQSRIRAEGTMDWRAIGELPELALSQGPGTGAPPLALPPREDSKRIVAGIFGILIGSLGIHKFILGYNTAGIIMLLVTILTCGIGGAVMHVIGLIEGIIYLTKSDAEFIRTYEAGRREWF